MAHRAEEEAAAARKAEEQAAAKRMAEEAAAARRAEADAAAREAEEQAVAAREAEEASAHKAKEDAEAARKADERDVPAHKFTEENLQAEANGASEEAVGGTGEETLATRQTELDRRAAEKAAAAERVAAAKMQAAAAMPQTSAEGGDEKEEEEDEVCTATDGSCGGGGSGLEAPGPEPASAPHKPQQVPVTTPQPTTTQRPVTTTHTPYTPPSHNEDTRARRERYTSHTTTPAPAPTPLPKETGPIVFSMESLRTAADWKGIVVALYSVSRVLGLWLSTVSGEAAEAAKSIRLPGLSPPLDMIASIFGMFVLGLVFFRALPTSAPSSGAAHVTPRAAAPPVVAQSGGASADAMDKLQQQVNMLLQKQEQIASEMRALAHENTQVVTALRTEVHAFHRETSGMEEELLLSTKEIIECLGIGEKEDEDHRSARFPSHWGISEANKVPSEPLSARGTPSPRLEELSVQRMEEEKVPESISAPMPELVQAAPLASEAPKSNAALFDSPAPEQAPAVQNPAPPAPMPVPSPAPEPPKSNAALFDSPVPVAAPLPVQETAVVADSLAPQLGQQPAAPTPAQAAPTRDLFDSPSPPAPAPVVEAEPAPTSASVPEVTPPSNFGSVQPPSIGSANVHNEATPAQALTPAQGQPPSGMGFGGAPIEQAGVQPVQPPMGIGSRSAPVAPARAESAASAPPINSSSASPQAPAAEPPAEDGPPSGAAGGRPQQQPIVSSASPFGARPTQQPIQAAASPFGARPTQQPIQAAASPFGARPTQQPIQATASPFGARPEQKPIQAAASPFGSR